MKQVISSVLCILICVVLAVLTVSMMEGAAEDSHAKVHHSAEDHYIFQFIAFLIYLLVVGVATGKLKKFKIKIGPVEFSKGTQRYKKDK